MVTYSSITLALTIGIAILVKFILARQWLLRARVVVLAAILLPLPAVAWWAAFNSLGSGWGFGIIAIMLSMPVCFGIFGGAVWHFVGKAGKE